MARENVGAHHQQAVVDAVDERLPTGSENSSQGSAAATPMNVIDNSLRVSREASSGRATTSTPSPRLEMVLAVHKRQKAGKPGLGVSRIHPGPLRPTSLCLPNDCSASVVTLVVEVGKSCRRTLPDDVVGRLSTRRISFGAMYIGRDSAAIERIDASVGGYPTDRRRRSR